jgi:hypothetical protein
MLPFARYGTKTVLIGVDEYMVYCPSCESDAWAQVGIISNYYHLYYIPVFPFEKDAYVICQKCGLKRGGVPFNEKLINDFDEAKRKYKHPWYTYTGIGFIIFLILLGIIL